MCGYGFKRARNGERERESEKERVRGLRERERNVHRTPKPWEIINHKFSFSISHSDSISWMAVDLVPLYVPISFSFILVVSVPWYHEDFLR